MNTEFAMQTLKDMRVKSMYELIAFSAITHGKMVLESQKRIYIRRKTIDGFGNVQRYYISTINL